MKVAYVDPFVRAGAKDAVQADDGFGNSAEEELCGCDELIPARSECRDGVTGDCWAQFCTVFRKK